MTAHLPRPLDEEAPGLRRRARRRPAPEAIDRQGARLDSRARGRVMLFCVAALIVLPTLANACSVEVRTDGHDLRVEAADGVERVKMEIGYRKAGAAGTAGRTYYQVVSAPVAVDGAIAYRPPMAAEFVSAMVLDAAGPGCD